MKKITTLLLLIFLCFGLSAQTNKTFDKEIEKHRKAYKKEFRQSDESPVYGKNLRFENGKLTLDFNKCYNPWCAYSDGYFCPVPPSENVLEIAIEAGEKKYMGEKLHRRK